MTPTSSEQLNELLDNKNWPHFYDVTFDNGDECSVPNKQTITCSLTIKPELSYLAGHFPEQPIVPGVVQVHWAGELSKQFFACDGFSSLKKVKFSNPILPETSLVLSLSYKKNSNQVDFIYSDDLQAYSSGVISFQ